MELACTPGSSTPQAKMVCEAEAQRDLDRDWRQAATLVRLLRQVPVFRGLSWEIAADVADRHAERERCSRLSGTHRLDSRAPQIALRPEDVEALPLVPMALELAEVGLGLQLAVDHVPFEQRAQLAARRPDLTFAELRGNTVGNGWLDVGLEYVYSHRNVYGGTVATVPVGLGLANANRVVGSVTARF